VNKFLAGMTPAQKKIFYVTVFFVVLALFDRLLIGPTVAKLGSIDESIRMEEDSIKGDLRFLAYKDRINKESKSYEMYYVKGTPKDDQVMAAFLEKLDKFVSQSGLTLLKNNRSSEQKDADKESKDFYTYRAELEASGSLDNVVKLMYAINTSPDFMKIVKLNLAMKKNGEVEELKAAMTIAKYIISSETPSTATPAPATKSSVKPAK
jgi:hypothetical protein